MECFWPGDVSVAKTETPATLLKHMGNQGLTKIFEKLFRRKYTKSPGLKGDTVPSF